MKPNEINRSLQKEMESASLGDKRLSKRAGSIVQDLSKNCSSAFSKVFASEAYREAFYRFVRNPHVKWQALFSAHSDATVKRAAIEEEILVAHDTTNFEFGAGADREGLGWVSHKSKTPGFKSQGFFGHFALAIRSAGDRGPLGVLGFEPYKRMGTPKKPRRRFTDPEKESLRWGRMIELCEGKLRGKTTPIHVMDREADSYELLCQMYQSGYRFVVRLCYDRRIKSETNNFISEALAELPWVCFREVKLAARKKPKGTTQQKRYPERKMRMAKLGFKATTVKIQCPEKIHRLNKVIELNIIHVYELDSPDDVQPIEWKIITTEPIETQENILTIVDYYQTRWLIEDYFKALKTGCKYEERQLESYQTLLTALILLIPVAWQLLLLRYLSRTADDQPARNYFSESELYLLDKRADYDMPPEPNLKDALWAIAALGGHIKNNGEPGWLVLMRGFQDLLKLDIGYQIAREKM